MSVTLSEVFRFPAARRSFFIREEFIGICAFSPSPHCAGAILSVLDRWTRFRAEERQKIRHDNAVRAKSNQPGEKLPAFWIFMSMEQYSREMLFLFGERTIRDTLNWLCDQRYIVRRKNPTNGFDKVYQYRLMRTRIQYAIDVYDQLNLYFDTGFSAAPKRQKKRSEAAKLPVRDGKNGQTPQSPTQRSSSQRSSTEEDARARANAAAEFKMSDVSIDSETPIVETETDENAMLEEPTPNSAVPPPAEEAPLPPAVLHGLGMPSAANVAKQERQAKDYRKAQKHPLYIAFAQAWADSLPGKTDAEREALIPQLRPDNAARHLDTIKLLELMHATPDHVRTIVLAKREKGKSEYPFAWLPDDVQKQIVAETDADMSVDPETGYTPINMEPAPINVPGAAPDDHRPWKPHVITDEERQQFASVLGPKPKLPGAAQTQRERA